KSNGVELTIHHEGRERVSHIQLNILALLNRATHIQTTCLQRLNQTLLMWLSCEGDSRISLLKSIRDELRRSVHKLLIVRIKPDLMPADIVRVICLQLTRNRDAPLPASAYLTPKMSRFGVE